MRVMVIVKATRESEAEIKPGDGKLLKEMGAFNEELVKAGIMLAGEGLKPSKLGKAGPVLGREPNGDRRTVHGDQGARGRLLALAGEVHAGGGGVGEALPQPHAGHRFRDRDPASLRDGRLRGGRPHGRAPQARERAAKDYRRAAAPK